MMPHLQLDEVDNSLYLTDENKIVNLKLNEKNYHFENDNKKNINEKMQVFKQFPSTIDVKGFIKKDDYLYSYSE